MWARDEICCVASDNNKVNYLCVDYGPSLAVCIVSSLGSSLRAMHIRAMQTVQSCYNGIITYGVIL